MSTETKVKFNPQEAKAPELLDNRTILASDGSLWILFYVDDDSAVLYRLTSAHPSCLMRATLPRDCDGKVRFGALRDRALIGPWRVVRSVTITED